MAELISPGNKLASAPRPNLELFFAAPAELNEGMSDEDWDAEMRRMFQHSIATQRLLKGEITPADYECFLAESGIDPYNLIDFWENGGSHGF